jgi:hypothetical protein
MAGAAVHNKDGHEGPGELTLLRRACFRGAGLAYVICAGRRLWFMGTVSG